jgi:hypothetical protein
MLSRYITSQANTLICSLYLGLSATASYALSIQIITILLSFSSIYYSTNQPLLNEANQHNNLQKKICVFSKSWVVFVFTFVTLSIVTIYVGFPLLRLVGSKTQINFWVYAGLTIYLFLEANHSLFASYISTGNTLPYTFPFLISSIISLILSVTIVKTTDWGVWGLILPPLIVQLVYNNWKWPQYALFDLGMTPKSFLHTGVKTINYSYLKYILAKRLKKIYLKEEHDNQE